MTRLRTALILSLVLIPLAMFVVVAAWSMWETGRLLWLWWLLPLCWGLAYLLARRRVAKFEIEPQDDSPLPTHWTDRDRSAFELVVARQQAVQDIAPDQLTDARFYVETALELSHEVAHHYHPQAKDPLGSLTLMEILSAAELAAEDLQHWVQNYVPGSHLLTIDNWKLLGRVPEWAKTAGDVTWAVSMLFDPTNLARYIASRSTISPLTDQIQANILAAFYVAFVRRSGRYLIEMNSGRLRGGAARYRSLLNRFDETSGASQPAEIPEVTIAVIGQCKAGKSSLINTLLREKQAATDVLPRTTAVERYQLRLPEASDSLVVLDTGGYADDGASAAQLKEMQEALRQADLVLLVMDAKNPAREADLQILREMAAWVDSQPTLKRSPIVGVLTHIDLLSPTMEWSPPYKWEQPTAPKEKNIRDAVDYHRELFGSSLDGVVPVCSDAARGRAFGTEEWLLPVMTALLSEAKACSLVRTLHGKWDAGKARTFMGQLLNAGNELLRVIATDAKPSDDTVQP